MDDYLHIRIECGHKQKLNDFAFKLGTSASELIRDYIEGLGNNEMIIKKQIEFHKYKIAYFEEELRKIVEAKKEQELRDRMHQIKAPGTVVVTYKH